MTERPLDREASVPVEELIDLKSDPCDISLDDVCGLEDETEKLQRLYIPGVADQSAPIQEPSLLVHGPQYAGQNRIARAVITEFVDRGFQWTNVSARNLLRDEAAHPERADRNAARLIESLTGHAPAVLLIEDFEEMQFGSERHFARAIDDLRERSVPVAVISVLTIAHQRYSPHRSPDQLEFADFMVGLGGTGVERRAKVLLDRIKTIVQGSNLRVTVGVDDVVAQLDAVFPISDVDRIARRSVLLAHSSEDTAEITIEEVTTAIEHKVADEPEYMDSTIRNEDDDGFQPDVPDVGFDAVGGLDETIERLRELVTLPQQYADLYAGTRLSPSSGVLLYGPPGTGKTLLAKALANELDRTFFAVEGAEVKNMWYGQSEQQIQTVFASARDAAPSVVFFDEFDALARDRAAATHSATRSIVNTLLAELDGMDSDDEVLVIAATNRPDGIDPAIRRPGRLGEAIEVPPPDEDGRREIFAIYTDDIDATVDPSWLASQTPEGTTGADIAAIVERAIRRAVRRTSDTETSATVTRADARAVIKQICTEEAPRTNAFR